MQNIFRLLISIILILSLVPIKNFAQTNRDNDFSITAPQDSVQGEKPDTVTVVKKSPTGAMLRSLFVPGWGQLYNGKWFKAILVCGTEIGLVANAVYQNQMAVQSTFSEERAWYQDNRNLSVWWLLATILLSMADAFVDAHLYDFDESPDLSHKIAPLHCYRKSDLLSIITISVTL